MASFRHSKKLGELAPLFLTQQQLCKYYKVVSSQAVGDEVTRALRALNTLFDGDEEDFGLFFRGFLVKAFNKLLSAFILVPIHTVTIGGEDGMLVEVRMHEEGGRCVYSTLPVKGLWPTDPTSQERANKEPNKTLCDDDLYYVVAATELYGDQYLFPAPPRVTQLRKRLLRNLAHLLEWRHKQVRCDEVSQRADVVEDRIAAARRELDLTLVGGQYRVPSNAEKEAIYARIDHLEKQHRILIGEVDTVGLDEAAMKATRGRVEWLLGELEAAVAETMRAVADELERSRSSAGVGAAAAAAAEREWEAARRSPAAPQDPRRQGGGGGGLGSSAHPGAAPLVRPRAGVGQGAFSGDYDSPPAAKRLLTHQHDDAGRGSQGFTSPQPTQLQMDFMRAHADLIRLMYKNDAIEDDGSENWSKLSPEAVQEARTLRQRWKALETELIAARQHIPNEIEVAEFYAALQHQQPLGQDGAQQGDWPMLDRQQLGEGQQPEGPASAHFRQQQQQHHHHHHHHRGWHAHGPQDLAGGSLQHEPPQSPLAKPRVGVMAVTGAPGAPCRTSKWDVALGRGMPRKDVEKKLKSARIWTQPMRSSGAAATTAAGGATGLDFSELRNGVTGREIPLVFPALEDFPPDWKELFPEFGVLSFEDDSDLASMVEFAAKWGWYCDSGSAVVRCGCSTVALRGRLEGKLLTVYVLTHKSSWARQELASQLPDAQKQLFLNNKAFLLMLLLAPAHARPAEMPNAGGGAADPALPTRGSGGRNRPGVPAAARVAETAGYVPLAAARRVAAMASTAAAPLAGPGTAAAANVAAQGAAVDPVAAGSATPEPVSASAVPAATAEAIAAPVAAVVASAAAPPASEALAAPSIPAAVDDAAGPAVPTDGAAPEAAGAQQPGDAAAPAAPQEGAGPPAVPAVATAAGAAAPQLGSDSQPQPLAATQPAAVQPNAAPAAGGTASWAYAAGVYPPPQAAYPSSHWGYAGYAAHGAHAAAHAAYSAASASCHAPYIAGPYNQYAAQRPYYYPTEPSYSQSGYAAQGCPSSWHGCEHTYGAPTYGAPQVSAPQQPYAGHAPAAEQALHPAPAPQAAAPAEAAAAAAVAGAPWRALDPEPVRAASVVSMDEGGTSEEEAVAGPARMDEEPQDEGTASLGTAPQVEQAPGDPSAHEPPAQAGQGPLVAAATPAAEVPLHGQQPLDWVHHAPPELPLSPPPLWPTAATAERWPEREASPPSTFSSSSDEGSAAEAPQRAQPTDTAQHAPGGPPRLSPPRRSPPAEAAERQLNREASPPSTFSSSSSSDDENSPAGAPLPGRPADTAQDTLPRSPRSPPPRAPPAAMAGRLPEREASPPSTFSSSSSDDENSPAGAPLPGRPADTAQVTLPGPPRAPPPRAPPAAMAGRLPEREASPPSTFSSSSNSESSAGAPPRGQATDTAHPGAAEPPLLQPPAAAAAEQQLQREPSPIGFFSDGESSVDEVD